MEKHGRNLYLHLVQSFIIRNETGIFNSWIGGNYMVSYEPLWQTMKNKEISTYTLIEKYDIHSKTIYNLKHNKNITTATLETLCGILSCTTNDVLTFTKEKTDN